jgi:Domain of unknown function (DUF4345)
MGKRALQIVTAILGLIPLATGLIGLLGVGDPLYVAEHVPHAPLVDSNLRFFAGVWLGLGLALLWLVPKIESQTVLFRAIWAAIFLGGVGRLLSMAFLATPPAPFIGFTTLEVVGAPIFIYWQARVAGAAIPASG